ncbi:MAG: PTS sugar transporter subunit IIA [Rectinemataceae bacterium]
MLLQQAFSPARIKIGLESEHKDELFEELVDTAARDYRGSAPFPRRAMLAALEEREAKMSTGILKGIAIPHARVAGIDGLTGVIGVSSKGIDYDALDGSPVFLVFMLLSPPGESELHLQSLRNLARLLEMPGFQMELLASGTSERAFATIKKYEEILSSPG